MAWIEVHQSLLTHRKTLRLCRLLKMDKYAVTGRLVALWCWALDNAPDGRLPATDLDLLTDVCGFEGDGETFAQALESAGFLEVDEEDGQYIIHDWQDYGGKLFEQRQANARRQKTWRDRQKEASAEQHNHHVTVTLPLHNVLEDRTEQYPTEENRTDTSVKEKEHTFLKKGEVRREAPLASSKEASLEHRPSNLFLKKSLTSQNRADASPEPVPKGKKAMNEEDFDLGALPNRIYERFTPEQIREQYNAARAWCRGKPKAVCSLSFFLRWLDRINEADVIPPNETEVQRITRIMQKKPNEKGIIDGQTYTNWKMKLQAAKQEEKEQAYEAASGFSRLGSHLSALEVVRNHDEEKQP